MSSISDTELVKALKKDEIVNVYYFYGRDVRMVEDFARRLASKLVKREDEDCNLHKFDGQNMDFSAFADCAEALPMFAPDSCIVVNDLDMDLYNASDFEQLEATISDLPDSTVVIFYNTGLDVFKGKKYPSDKNNKLIKLVSKLGTVCEFKIKTPSDLAKGITDRVQKAGCEISRKNAEYIASSCLCDSLAVKNEVDKLISYRQKGEITAADIDLLVPKQTETNAFNLAKAVVSVNPSRAMVLLDELFEQRADAIPLLSIISSSFLDIYRVKLAMIAGKKADEVAADFGYAANRKFLIENAYSSVKKISAQDLRKCIIILKEADKSLKYSVLSSKGRFVTERAIVEMTAVCKGE